MSYWRAREGRTKDRQLNPTRLKRDYSIDKLRSHRRGVEV